MPCRKPRIAVLALALIALPGCHSIWNGWLDPTSLGNFESHHINEIRTSLTLEDTPSGIPNAVPPTKEDLLPISQRIPISPGDTLDLEIYQLRQPGVPYQAGVVVNEVGELNIPVLGRVKAEGLTVAELEDSIAQTLREKDILTEPEVTLNPIFRHNASYSIFGIGASAANNAPLRAGTFPLRRPDTRLLEAINQVGGLSEFVTEVYVFRREDEPASGSADLDRPNASGASGDRDRGMEDEHSDARPDEDVDTEPGAGAAGEDASQGADLIEAVLSLEGDPTQGEPTQPETQQDDPEEDADLLRVEPTTPWIFKNDKFVPNPAYVEGREGNGRSDAASTEPETTGYEWGSATEWARLAEGSTIRIIRVPAESLRSGDPQYDIIVRSGDVIRIFSGEIGLYYVMGQVLRPGPFRFNAEPITLKAAIAIAGGLGGLAWPDRCTVYRRIGQREQMIQVDLDRIFAGKEPDFFIRRNDIINVGTHPFAPFLRRLRALTLPNPIANLGYSLTYSRNFADIDSFGAKQNPANVPDQFPNLFP